LNQEVKGSFAVEIDRLHQMGVIDPTSPKSIEIYKSGKLNSNERLYFSLWGSKEFSSVAFNSKQKIFTAGDEVDTAYFIVSGFLLGVDGPNIYRLGPGSVIGLAEGMVNQPIKMTVVCTTAVHARAIPLHKVDRIIEKMPEAAKGFFKTAINRILKK
jgi:CRP-like cAMP-binding protein